MERAEALVESLNRSGIPGPHGLQESAGRAAAAAVIASPFMLPDSSMSRAVRTGRAAPVRRLVERVESDRRAVHLAR